MMHPEPVFQSLAESAHCLIITSGTLAPTASFASELGNAFSVRMLRPPVEAPHVIQASQLGLAFVGNSRNNIELKCVRERMVHSSFLQALGQTLCEIIAAIPGGVLVFLPSRLALDMALRVWQ